MLLLQILHQYTLLIMAKTVYISLIVGMSSSLRGKLMFTHVYLMKKGSGGICADGRNPPGSPRGWRRSGSPSKEMFYSLNDKGCIPGTFRVVSLVLEDTSARLS